MMNGTIPGQPRVKSGGILARTEHRCADLERQVEELQQELRERERDRMSKDEKLDVTMNMVTDLRRLLQEEKEKNRMLHSQVEVLSVSLEDKRTSKLVLDMSTAKAYSTASTKTNGNAPTAIAPAPRFSNRFIEAEVEQLIAKLATVEADLATQRERCGALEGMNADLVEQRNCAQRHAEVVLKDKQRLMIHRINTPK